MSIISVIAYMTLDYANDDIQADSSMSTEAKNVTGSLYEKFPTLLDNLILMSIVLLSIAVLVSVMVLDSHPIFFIITVILLLSVFVASILLANVYDDLMTDSELGTYANDFPYATWISTHLIQIVISLGFLFLIALYIKFKYI